MMKKVALLVVVLLLVVFTAAYAADEVRINNYTNAWAGGDAGCLELKDDYLLPVDTDVTYNGASSVRVNITSNGSWWTALFFKSMDWTPYVEEGYIEVAIKGENGGEEVGIGLRSGDGETEVNAVKAIKADKEWSLVRIPIKELVDANPNWKYDDSNSFVIRKVNDNTLKVWVSDIKIISSDSSSEPVSNPTTGDFGILPYLLGAGLTGVTLLKRKRS